MRKLPDDIPYYMIKELMDELSKENPKICQVIGTLAMSIQQMSQKITTLENNQEILLKKLGLIPT